MQARRETTIIFYSILDRAVFGIKKTYGYKATEKKILPPQKRSMINDLAKMPLAEKAFIYCLFFLPLSSNWINFPTSPTDLFPSFRASKSADRRF